MCLATLNQCNIHNMARIRKMVQQDQITDVTPLFRFNERDARKIILSNSSYN